MTLDAQSVRAALFPRPVQFFERVDSTNDIALDWLRQGAPAGAVVIADEQVKGRGRLGRHWYTPPGTALILSIILRPGRHQIPHLTMLGALAICEMLEQLGAEDVGIKWPNDVHLNGRKVSGVLTEVIWKGNEVEGAVLGMGINVRIDFGGTELADTAISIEPALGKPISRLDLLVSLLTHLDSWTPGLGTNDLYQAWRMRLTTIGQNVTVDGSEGHVHGLTEDVDEDGSLLVRDADDRLHRVIADDIVLGDRSAT
jgi:BirA family biotin operon repressor/biotin-[acetyl-CoA-carboxylase] ligase